MAAKNMLVGVLGWVSEQLSILVMSSLFCMITS